MKSNLTKPFSAEPSTEGLLPDLLRYDRYTQSDSGAAFYAQLQQALSDYAVSQGADALANLYREMTMANCHAEFHRDITLKKNTIALHSHSFYELIYVVRGRVSYLLGNHRTPLQPGDLILVPPGVSHRPLFQGELEEPYERYVLWLNADYYRELLERQKGFDYCFQYCAKTDFILHLPAAGQREMLEDFKSGFRENTNRDFCSGMASQIVACSILLKLNRLCSHLSTEDKSPPQSELLEEVLQFMDDHIGEKLSLEVVAGRFFVSQSTISHLFRQSLDTSFYQCLLQKRLLLAKERLTGGEAATKLWAECGFGDYSVFYRAFKKAFGFSPKEYIKLYGGQNPA